MTLGPLEYSVFGFEGNNFDGSIAREIAKVVENGTIALVDVVFIGRDGDGNPSSSSSTTRTIHASPAFTTLVAGTDGPVHARRPRRRSPRSLPDGHVGPGPALRAPLGGRASRRRMADAGGFLVARSVIPPEVVEEVSAELDEAAAATAQIRASLTRRRDRQMMMRRRGRPLMRAAATTAVVAGTAGAVQHHQQQKYATQEAAAAGTGAGRLRAGRRGRPAAGNGAAPPPPAAPSSGGIDMEQLKQLARSAHRRCAERRGVRSGQGEAAGHVRRRAT